MINCMWGGVDVRLNTRYKKQLSSPSLDNKSLTNIGFWNIETVRRSGIIFEIISYMGNHDIKLFH